MSMESDLTKKFFLSLIVNFSLLQIKKAFQLQTQYNKFYYHFSKDCKVNHHINIFDVTGVATKSYNINFSTAFSKNNILN